jgi:hypothetical protein
MTAPSSPNHRPDIANAAHSEQQGFAYDDANTPEYDPNYVPEREFVLMPLFRRIGETLGIRRRSEAEAHYAPEPVTPRAHAAAETEHLSPAPGQFAEEHAVGDQSEAMRADAEVPAEPESDVLGIGQRAMPELAAGEQPEPVTATLQQAEQEPVMLAREMQVEPEPLHQRQMESERTGLARGMEESFATPTMAAAEDRAEPSVVPKIQPAVTRVARPQPASTRSALTQDDIRQLAGQIGEAARDAATKISAAISQAAEWLETKEEEILRRADMPAERRTAGGSRAPLGALSESDTAVPALQREVAWREQQTDTKSEEFLQSHATPVPRKKEARSAERRLQVVPKPKRPALWKRINWAQEFTPKRVAILGGLAMAMLMIVGISLARRPASSVLPQETHTIQPGGVTLSTHPRTGTVTAPAPPQAQGRSNPAPQRQSVTPVRSSRSAAYDDGPDVVTHYHNKQKPSPVHQSTVAGVKHYSDM